MSKISFNSYDDETGRSVSMELPEDSTWHAAAEDFFSFLQGCGYILSREDFAEYWSQYLDDVQSDEGECCGGCTNECDSGTNFGTFANNTMSYNYTIDPNTLATGTITIKTTE